MNRMIIAMAAVLLLNSANAQFFGGETKELPRFSGKWSVSAPAKIVDGRYLVVEIPTNKVASGCIATVPVDLSPFSDKTLKAIIHADGVNVVSSSASEKSGFVVCGFSYVDPETKLTCYSQPWEHESGTFGKDLSVRTRLPPSAPTNGYFRLGLWQMTGRITFDLDTLRMGVESMASLNADYRITYPDRVKAMPLLRGAQVSAHEITEDDFKTMHEWGMTLIRYQMTRQFSAIGANRDLDDYRRFIDGKVDQLLERVLPRARKYGIKVCVCLHVTPGGRDASRELALFRERPYYDAFIETWRRIATRCRGNEDVIYGYDLMNEPVQFDGVEEGMDYWNVQRRAAELVRSIDPKTTIIIEGNIWDPPASFSDLPALKMDNVIYQVHMYQPGQYTHQGVLKGSPIGPVYPDPEQKWDRNYIRRQMRKVREFQLAHDARIYVGEFSAAAWAKGADRYIEDCVSVFEEYGWDWSYHAFREWPGWSVEHEGPDKNHLKPSADNPRKRALIRCLRGSSAAENGR